MDQRLSAMRAELETIKLEYARNLDERDDRILSLRRELELAQQEINLNSEFQELAETFQQSSDKKRSPSSKTSASKKSNRK